MEDIKSDVESVFRHDAETFYKEHIEDKSMQKKALSLLDKNEDFPLDIVVCRNTSKKWHIPLPPAGGHKALSEEELRQVSGGEIIGALFIAASSTVTAMGSIITYTFLGGLVGSFVATSFVVGSSVSYATAAVGGALFVAGTVAVSIAAAAVAPAVAIGLGLGLSK